MVFSTDRACRMKIQHNIPSMIMVRGVKLRVDYSGQPKTCSRCFKYWGACPGDGKADKCKKAGGEEAKLGVFFRKLVKKLKKGPVNEKQSIPRPVVPAYIPDPDQVRFSGFPEDFDLKTFKEWLDGNKIAFLDTMCFQGNKPGSFTIETVEGEDGEKCSIDAAEAEEMVAKLNGQLFKKRTITVTMAQLTTPEKTKKTPEMVTLDSSGEDIQPPPTGQLALPAPEAAASASPSEASAETPNKVGDGEDDEDMKTPEGNRGEPNKPVNPEREALKMRILKEVTESGTVNNKIEKINDKVERKVGDKCKRADTSGSSLESSPVLNKPPAKKPAGGSKKNSDKKKNKKKEF